MLPQPGIHVGKAYLNIPEIEDAYLPGITKALVKTKEQIKRNDIINYDFMQNKRDVI